VGSASGPKSAANAGILNTGHASFSCSSMVGVVGDRPGRL